MPQRLWVMGGGLASLLVAACSKDVRLGPPLAPCTATGGGAVSQSYAALTVVDPTQTAGCAVFPDNTTGAAIEYLLLAQSASVRDNDSSAFRLYGAIPAAAAPRALASAAAPASPAPGAQERFDLMLRRAEQELTLSLGPPSRPQAAPRVAAAPPLGDVRQFKVCGDSLCLTHPLVKATAKTVGARIVIYVDSTDIKSGDTLGTADLASFAALFDTLLYPADTAAFGRESDIDHNGVVIVLMTGKVDALAPKPCNGTYIAGYFYGGDLLLGYKGGNNAEIFYSMVPDPLAKLSCIAHSVSDVKNGVPGTFIHEFQHMISFNQHYLLRGGNSEELWLNEAMSHYAEELGGRLFTPGDSARFCQFTWRDLFDAGLYFSNPEQYFVVEGAGTGGLGNRGAYWLFLRFLVDHFASDTSIAAANVVTRMLDSTRLTGAANVFHVTSTPFATLVEHWGLANFLSDRPGFPTPPELQYAKWRFRTDFRALHDRCLALGVVDNQIPLAYPLVPDSGAGETLNLSGVLRAGTATYFLAQQAAGAAGFTLLFSDGSGRALRTGLAPRLNVIRIQ